MAIWLLFTFDTLYSKAATIQEIEFKGSEEISELKKLTLYANCAKSVLYFFSCIFTAVERKNLIKEVDSAPLSIVDESLTEELYQNIIQQSKYPNDEKLIADYQRITLNRQPKVSCKSNPSNTLDESSGSGALSVNRVAGSINFNTSSSKDRTSNFVKKIILLFRAFTSE